MTAPRYVFACSNRHRVAVDAARYWAAARCPVCKSPLDRFRRARLRQWIRGAAPRSRLRAGAFVLTPLDGLGWLLVIAMLLVAVSMGACARKVATLKELLRRTASDTNEAWWARIRELRAGRPLR